MLLKQQQELYNQQRRRGGAGRSGNGIEQSENENENEELKFHNGVHRLKLGNFLPKVYACSAFFFVFISSFTDGFIWALCINI